MENMKIYRDGKYDTKLNITFKLQMKIPAILNRIDSFFVNHK